MKYTALLCPNLIVKSRKVKYEGRALHAWNAGASDVVRIFPCHFNFPFFSPATFLWQTALSIIFLLDTVELSN